MYRCILIYITIYTYMPGTVGHTQLSLSAKKREQKMKIE